jgi:hypothetical protein
MRRNVIFFAGLVLFGALSPSVACGSQLVKLKARFSPDRLGASTTIRFGFTIKSTNGGVPSPVTDVQIFLPAGMGLGTADLGEETCNQSTIVEFGPDGCSPNSRMGTGNASVEIPVGSMRVKINAQVVVFMGVPQNHHTTMLIYAETVTPVYGQYFFPSELLPATGAYGAKIHTAMPIIPTWPEGPPAVIVHMETTLGPSHLTYYRRDRGKRIGYRPTGMAIPEVCPRGGFPFAAYYHFLDGSTTSSRTSVPCPRAF